MGTGVPHSAQRPVGEQSAIAVQGLAPADFVIEAVRESEDIKRSVFMRLDQVTQQIQPRWPGAHAATSGRWRRHCHREGDRSQWP